MYILQQKYSYAPEYLILQVESFSDNGFSQYTIRHTENLFDATKFLCINDAFVMIEEVCPNPEDWDVILFEEE